MQIFDTLLEGGWWTRADLMVAVVGQDGFKKTFNNNFAHVKNLNVFEESADKRPFRFDTSKVFPYGRPDVDVETDE